MVQVSVCFFPCDLVSYVVNYSIMNEHQNLSKLQEVKLNLHKVEHLRYANTFYCYYMECVSLYLTTLRKQPKQNTLYKNIYLIYLNHFRCFFVPSTSFVASHMSPSNRLITIIVLQISLCFWKAYVSKQIDSPTTKTCPC